MNSDDIETIWFDSWADQGVSGERESFQVHIFFSPWADQEVLEDIKSCFISCCDLWVDEEASREYVCYVLLSLLSKVAWTKRGGKIVFKS